MGDVEDATVIRAFSTTLTRALEETPRTILGALWPLLVSCRWGT